MDPLKPAKPAEILIVEDSRTQAEQLRFVLEGHGFVVHHARNGVEALAHLAQFRPLAVISDINMPEMDGYELCRRLRADAALARVPTILLTSLSNPADVMQALECGADYFFTKPFDEAILVPRLRFIQENLALPDTPGESDPLTIRTDGALHRIHSSRRQAVNLLLSTYESAVAQNRRLQEAEAELRQLNEHLEARVNERTAALVRANAALEAENQARRQVEARLREQAELLDKANEAIITTDLDLRIRFWNRGAERLLGRPASAMLGRSLREVFSLDGSLGEVAGGAFVHQEDWRGELRTLLPEDRRLTLETSLTVLRDEASRALGWMSISTDVTEQKQLQEKFLRMQRLESIGMLASGIAHDLNNVLAPIGLAAALLRLRLSEKSDVRLLDTLENSVNRGAGLVRQILGFAQGIGGEPRVIQVKHLVRDLAAVINQTFPKSIVLEDSVPTDLWPILGQPTQIHQVLLNLCVNARDAMPAGGHLRLRAENCRLDAAAAAAIPGARPGAWLVLHVEDTGTGIPPDVLARIWDPFFTTKATDKGTGLGLATVRGIVETHHGFITVATAVGQGTTFRIYLPVTDGAIAGPEAAAPRPAYRGHGELILVVDDEESNRETVQDILLSHGYRVLAAADGAQGAEIVQQRGAELALVITDFDMPVLDGDGLAQIIRSCHPELRIIMITGVDDKASTLCDVRLGKPCEAAALLEEVHRLLIAARPTAS